MATPRAELVDPDRPAFYHLVSRCVRRSWLCGIDRAGGRNFDHRKAWLEQRLLKLSACYAVELFGFAIMSNHFHLIVRFDPLMASRWTDEDVAERWSAACSYSAALSKEDESLQRQQRFEAMLQDPAGLAKARHTLGSISLFMKHLKQPISWRANREDGCTGHFFESRFYSGALLDDTSLLTAMAYVDLNPVRAGVVQVAIDAEHTSLQHRLQAAQDNKARLDDYLAPLNDLDNNEEKVTTRLPITLRQYLDFVAQIEPRQESNKDDRWRERFTLFKRRQRAYGLVHDMVDWCSARGWSRAVTPFS